MRCETVVLDTISPANRHMSYTYISYKAMLQEDAHPNSNNTSTGECISGKTFSRTCLLIHSSALLSQSSTSSKVVSLVVPHTCHGPGLHASYFFCMTTYSTTFLSLPEPGTTSKFPPLLDHLVSFCLEDIRTTACLMAAPSIGNLAPRLDTIFARLLYFISSHSTVCPRGRLTIRARKLS